MTYVCKVLQNERLHNSPSDSSPDGREFASGIKLWSWHLSQLLYTPASGSDGVGKGGQQNRARPILYWWLLQHTPRPTLNQGSKTSALMFLGAKAGENEPKRYGMNSHPLHPRKPQSNCAPPHSNGSTLIWRVVGTKIFCKRQTHKPMSIEERPPFLLSV